MYVSKRRQQGSEKGPDTASYETERAGLLNMRQTSVPKILCRLWVFMKCPITKKQMHQKVSTEATGLPT